MHTDFIWFNGVVHCTAIMFLGFLPNQWGWEVELSFGHRNCWGALGSMWLLILSPLLRPLYECPGCYQWPTISPSPPVTGGRWEGWRTCILPLGISAPYCDLTCQQGGGGTKIGPPATILPEPGEPFHMVIKQRLSYSIGECSFYFKFSLMQREWLHISMWAIETHICTLLQFALGAYCSK